MGEREIRDTAATARSTSVVHYTERTQDAAARVVASLVDRSATTTEGNIVFLAITASPDDALLLSEAVVKLRQGASHALMPITSLNRGRRIVAVGSGIVTAPATLIAQLIAESRLVLPRLHNLVLLWPEELIADEEQRRALESVIAEVPRSAERVALCAGRSPELAQFLERSMWRAREIDHTTTVAPSSAGVRVFTATPAEQVRAVRSLLDTFDPQSAVLITFSDETERAARQAAALFDAGGALVRVHRGVPGERASLGIIFDDVPPADALTAAGDAFGELVAIMRPGNLAAFRKVVPNATPVAWTGAVANARSIQDSLRDEIRGYAGSGAHVPWISVIEPLLEGLDAVEVAASALAMLDRERRKAKKAAAAAPGEPVAARNVPDDRARPEPRTRGGEREGRGVAGKPPWSRGSRDSGDGGRHDRPRDHGDDRRRERPRERDERPRPDGRERGSRRGGDIERLPRAARESREWSERSERLRNSRRGPRRGDAG